jgi:D-threo-aldose 1-dehydrogenase
VFNSGILAQRVDPQTQATFNYASAQGHWLDKALKLQAVCDRHRVPIAAAALQFPLAHPATDIVLVGVRDVDQWRQARAHLRWPIAPEFWLELKRTGLLPPEAITP